MHTLHLLRRRGAQVPFSAAHQLRRLAQSAVDTSSSSYADPEAFRETVRTFAQRHVAPYAAHIDRNNW